MFFRCSNTKQAEINRVTKFKMVKSGKHWIRAAVSQFNFLGISRGLNEKIITISTQEGKKGQVSIFKGAIVTGALLGMGVNTIQAEALDSTTVVSEVESEQLVTKDSLVLGTMTSLNDESEKDVSELTSISIAH